jgi:hypothetical protein
MGGVFYIEGGGGKLWDILMKDGGVGKFKIER